MHDSVDGEYCWNGRGWHTLFYWRPFIVLRQTQYYEKFRRNSRFVKVLKLNCKFQNAAVCGKVKVWKFLLIVKKLFLRNMYSFQRVWWLENDFWMLASIRSRASTRTIVSRKFRTYRRIWPQLSGIPKP